MSSPTQYNDAVVWARYLDFLQQSSPEKLIGNARGVALQVMECEGQSFPALICHGYGGNAALLCPSAHYLEYPLVEMTREASPSVWGMPRRCLVRFLSLIFRGFAAFTRMDKVVYLDHWLTSAGPLEVALPTSGTEEADPDLRLKAFQGLIDSAQSSYPGHGVVVSCLVPESSDYHAKLSDQLMRRGGIAVRRRTVFLLPANLSATGVRNKTVRYNRGRDDALYEQHGSLRTTLRQVKDGGELATHARDLQCLYSSLYLDRHPAKLNSQYTPEFFEGVLGTGLFSTTVWSRAEEGEVEAFTTHLSGQRSILWSVCGFEPTANKSKGLYRQLTAHDAAVADAEGKTFNWGAGNEEYKRNRGAHQAVELDIVFFGHLNLLRRLPWLLLRWLRPANVERVARSRSQKPQKPQQPQPADEAVSDE